MPFLANFKFNAFIKKKGERRKTLQQSMNNFKKNEGKNDK